MLIALSGALHKSRLLNVEEKPFKRISKRLLDPEKSIISSLPTLPSIAPPGVSETENEDAASYEKERQDLIETYAQWREETLLDFAGFESSIIRIQLLLSSNEKERQRYATDKLNIQTNAQTVRDNTAELRIQLERAQRTQALRKEYDVLADQITSNHLLKPREEQRLNLEKLNAEIADLDQESLEYATIWTRRREQFNKILDQTAEMQRQIKDEKEEGDEDEQRGTASGDATPRPSSAGRGTPVPGGEKGHDAISRGSLSVKGEGGGRGRSPLRELAVYTPVETVDVPTLEEQDEDMAEDGEVSADMDEVKPDVPEGLVADEREEGEEDEQMDVT